MARHYCKRIGQLALAVSMATLAMAQNDRGIIAGTVQYPTGAVIPDVAMRYSSGLPIAVPSSLNNMNSLAFQSTRVVRPERRVVLVVCGKQINHYPARRVHA